VQLKKKKKKKKKKERKEMKRTRNIMLIKRTGREKKGHQKR
jgi:hypothetical protein